MKIKFGHTDLDVQFVTGASHGFDEWGWIQDHQITVREDQPPTEMVDTLLHELAHAALNRFGVQLEEAVEEQVVNAIASGFTEIFVRNRKVREWIEERM